MKAKILACAVISMILAGSVMAANVATNVPSNPISKQAIKNASDPTRTQVIRIENFLGNMGDGPYPFPGQTASPVFLKFYNDNDQTPCYVADKQLLKYGYGETALPGTGEFMWTGYSGGVDKNLCTNITRITVMPQLNDDYPVQDKPSYQEYTCSIDKQHPNTTAKLTHVILVQESAQTAPKYFDSGKVWIQGRMKCVVVDSLSN